MFQKKGAQPTRFKGGSQHSESAIFQILHDHNYFRKPVSTFHDPQVREEEKHQDVQVNEKEAMQSYNDVSGSVLVGEKSAFEEFNWRTFVFVLLLSVK